MPPSREGVPRGNDGEGQPNENAPVAYNPLLDDEPLSDDELPAPYDVDYVSPAMSAAFLRRNEATFRLPNGPPSGADHPNLAMTIGTIRRIPHNRITDDNLAAMSVLVEIEFALRDFSYPHADEILLGLRGVSENNLSWKLYSGSDIPYSFFDQLDYCDVRSLKFIVMNQLVTPLRLTAVLAENVELCSSMSGYAPQLTREAHILGIDPERYLHRHHAQERLNFLLPYMCEKHPAHVAAWRDEHQYSMLHKLLYSHEHREERTSRIAHWLLKAGCDPLYKNSFGESAFYIMLRGAHRELAEYLMDKYPRAQLVEAITGGARPERNNTLPMQLLEFTTESRPTKRYDIARCAMICYELGADVHAVNDRGWNIADIVQNCGWEDELTDELARFNVPPPTGANPVAKTWEERFTCRPDNVYGRVRADEIHADVRFAEILPGVRSDIRATQHYHSLLAHPRQDLVKLIFENRYKNSVRDNLRFKREFKALLVVNPYPVDQWHSRGPPNPNSEYESESLDQIMTEWKRFSVIWDGYLHEATWDL